MHGSIDFEDQNEKDDYIADYQSYVNEIRNRIAPLTPTYVLPMSATVLQMWVVWRGCECCRFQKGLVSTSLGYKSLLCITEGINVGMSRCKTEIKGHAEVISNGRKTVELLLQQNMGFNQELDQLILQSVFDYLWVLRKDTTLLLSFIERIVTLIGQASSLYKYASLGSPPS